MPLFAISNGRLETIEQGAFTTERELQKLIESNLETVFGCRLVASEFSTGEQHGGRIDTLALSEDNNPVILEYKRVESSELINQSLFYLFWLKDHRGDFELAAQRVFGASVEVDWSDIRVICIAPNYRKYDLHAVQVMGQNIELWRYRLYGNSTLHLEEVFQRSSASGPVVADSSDSSTAGRSKRSVPTRAQATYTFEEHLFDKPDHIKNLVLQLHERIIALDPLIEVAPRKHYIAYRISKNIVCIEVRKSELLLFVRLNPATLGELPGFARDVTNIGHFGTGDLELRISDESNVEQVLSFVELAHRKIGS